MESKAMFPEANVLAVFSRSNGVKSKPSFCSNCALANGNKTDLHESSQTWGRPNDGQCHGRMDTNLVPGPINGNSVLQAPNLDLPLRELGGRLQFSRGHQDGMNFGNISSGRDGARAPTPNSMSKSMLRQTSVGGTFGPDCSCQHPYITAPYICRPVFNRKYLLDCPEQDGPPPDTYTFL